VHLVFIFFTALVVGYSGALVPGPMFTLVVAESAGRGSRAGPLVTAGHVALELVVLAGLIAGLSQVLSLPVVTACISLVGGAVMVWMGCTMIARVARGRLAAPLADEGSGPTDGASLGLSRASRRGLQLVGLGAVVSFSNPYFSLWWATIGSAYLVSAALYGAPGIAAFFFGHTLADFSWFWLIACGVGYGRRFLTTRTYRGLIAVCGLALVGIAAYFVVRGVSGL